MIKGNKLSLTKKLDGGYLHVKKSPIKSSVKGSKGGYSNYLNKNNSSGSNNTSSSNNQSGGKGDSMSKGKDNSTSKSKDKSKKIVSVKLTSPKKKVSPRKVKRVKDIPDIIPKQQPVKQPTQPVKQPTQQVKQPPKQPSNQPAKQLAKKPIRQKCVPLQNVKVKGSLKKQQVLKRQSKGKRINKSLTKRRQHSSNRGKRISVTKTRKYSNKDVSMIQKKIKEIKGKSEKQIKDDLEKQGVKLSGKSPSLMKDIYMYSQLCGINIKRE